MKTAYHSAYDLDRYPQLAAVTRFVAGAVVIGTFSFAWMTAGPGNGYVPPEQWAAVHRSDVARVDLQRVEVVGHHAANQKVASAGCARGA